MANYIVCITCGHAPTSDTAVAHARQGNHVVTSYAETGKVQWSTK